MKNNVFLLRSSITEESIGFVSQINEITTYKIFVNYSRYILVSINQDVSANHFINEHYPTLTMCVLWKHN